MNEPLPRGHGVIVCVGCDPKGRIVRRLCECHFDAARTLKSCARCRLPWRETVALAERAAAAVKSGAPLPKLPEQCALELDEGDDV